MKHDGTFNLGGATQYANFLLIVLVFSWWHMCLDFSDYGRKMSMHNAKVTPSHPTLAYKSILVAVAVSPTCTFTLY